MSTRSQLQKLIEEVIAQHGGIRPTARATGVDATFLSKLRAGVKINPSDETLGKLGLARDVLYIRIPSLGAAAPKKRKNRIPARA